MMTRRNFFGWGAGALAMLTSIQVFFRKGKKDQKIKTAKMLTRDGRLVEVDISKLKSTVRLASKKEVQTWVWPDKDTPSKL